MSDEVRLRLDIAYDGTAFAGWARQRDQRTVQGVLTDALNTILRSEVALTVAGRTDSGVHAVGQVAHCDVAHSAWRRVADSAVRRLAGVLPDDVRVWAVTEVSGAFDARFSALRRHYLYRVTDHPAGADPLERHRELAWGRQLNVAAMEQASALLLGVRDFAAFCRRREGATTIRRLERLEWRPAGERRYRAHVSADAFCHSMVRSLIGALLAVGEGRRPVEWPASLLSSERRSGEVTVAPAHGLSLVAVDYPPEAELGERAHVTRRVRSLDEQRGDGVG